MPDGHTGASDVPSRRRDDRRRNGAARIGRSKKKTGPMVQKTNSATRRPSAEKLTPPRQHETGFKAVALPAVAAAVHAARASAPGKPAPREIPAVLRELGPLD